MSQPSAAHKSLPHAPLPHDSARQHVTGAAHYVDDIPLPANTLHLAFGLATVARGQITKLNLADVRAAPGVVAVWSADDLPRDIDVAPAAHDEPLLAKGEVHYLGQAVFLVIATSHLAARRAARMAQIDYAPQDPVLTIDQALEADSRFEDGPVIWQKGDWQVALAAAPNRLTGSLEVGGQEHFYLEGQAAFAIPQDGGGMLVHSSTQHPTEIQHKVAHALDLPMSEVRVEIRRMGGGFGGKESQGNALAVACALAAAHTGRAAKMRYDRDDDMIITGKRHDARIGYEVGFDASGRVLAVDFTHYIRCGWSADLSLPVADRAMLHADNAYLLPTIRITSHRLRTNTQSATAYRGFGGPQGMIGIERVMDAVAYKLALDPVQVRRANYYAEATMVQDNSPAAQRGQRISSSRGTGKRFGGAHSPEVKQLAQTTPYGMEVQDFILHAMTDQLLTSADYTARRNEIARANALPGPLKRGIAFSPVKFGISFTLTHLNQAGALVHVYQDGSLRLNHGGTEMGQGLNQKVAQVAASVFGLRAGAVTITATDTGKVPNTSATAASSGTDLNGMAAKVACETIRARMAVFLAPQAPEDVVFADGMVRIGTTEITFAKAAQLAYEARVSLSSTGFYKTPGLKWDRLKGAGRPFFYFAYGAAVSEVIIDTRTGENRIIRADLLHDAGRSLNPALDIGQVEGAYVQGAGWLTMEELIWDNAGMLKTHAPSTYKIPACSDRPAIFNVDLWQAPNREETIYRSKAVGEPPFMLGISAHLALSAAVSACGPSYPALNAPATPEQILRAIGRAQS